VKAYIAGLHGHEARLASLQILKHHGLDGQALPQQVLGQLDRAAVELHDLDVVL